MNLIETDREDRPHYFSKRIEMVKELKDTRCAEIMIQKAVQLSHKTRYKKEYTDSNAQAYIQGAIGLIISYGLESKSDSYFKEYMPVTAQGISKNCLLVQVYQIYF